MGNSSAQQQVGTPIDNHLMALLMTDQTDRVIQKLKSQGSKYYLNEAINYRGDNILHYACARNNIDMVQYLIINKPQLAQKPNNKNQLPAQLANDKMIKYMCDKKIPVARSSSKFCC